MKQNAQTELEALLSLRTQYRAAFKRMAANIGAERFHVHAGSVGVVLMPHSTAPVPAGAPIYAAPVLVRDVQNLTEQQAVNALSAAIKRAALEA